MTQTSLQKALDQAYELHKSLSDAMDAIKNPDGPLQSEQWHDLKVAFDAASAAASQLYQIIKREQEASEPVPYVLAGQ